MEGMTGASALSVVDAGLSRLSVVTSVGLLSVAGVWFALVPPESPGSPTWLALGSAMLGAAMIIAFIARSHPPPLRLSRIVCLVTSVALGLVVAMKMATGLLGMWPQVELVATAAVVAAAVALRPWSAVAWAVLVLVAVVAHGLPVSGVALLHLTPADLLAREARVGAVFLGLLVLSIALRRSGRRTDGKRSVLREGLCQEAVGRERRETRRRTRSSVHATLLNTLQGLSRGVDPRDEGALSTWGRQSVARWRAELQPDDADGPIRTGAALSAVVENERATGLLIDYACSGDPELPRPLIHVLAGATEEALRNVLEHSGVSRAQVTARLSERRVTVVIRDDGCGFDPDGTDDDALGLRAGVMAECSRVGARAKVRSAPGRGTTVTITWSPTPSTGAGPPQTPMGPDLQKSMGNALIGIVAITSLISLAGLGANVTAYTDVPLAAVTVFATALVAMVVLFRHRRGSLSRALAWSSVAVGLAVLMVTPIVDTYCAAWVRTSAFPEGNIMALIVPVVLVRSRRFLPAVIAAYLTAGAVTAVLWVQVWPGCSGDFVFTTLVGGVLIIGSGQLGRVVRESSDRAEQVAAWEMEAGVRAERLAERRQILAEWELPLAHSAVALIERVTRKPILAQSAAIRREAGELEARLRVRALSAGVVGPFADVLRDIVSEVEEGGGSLELAGPLDDLDESGQGVTCAAEALAGWFAGYSVSEGDRVRVRVSATARWQGALTHVPRRLPSAPAAAVTPAECVELDEGADPSGTWLRLEWMPLGHGDEPEVALGPAMTVMATTGGP